MAILHPNIFYFILDSNWSSTNNLEYWNKGNIATTVNNNIVYKTIYSPSPTGYKEPITAAFTGFTTTGIRSTDLSQINVSGSFNNGYNIYCQPNFTGGTVFFPVIAYRDILSSRVNNTTAGTVGANYGNYWTAGPSNRVAGHRYHLGFSSGNMIPTNDSGGAIRFNLRSVSE